MHFRRTMSYAIATGVITAVSLLSSCTAGGSAFTANASDITGIWKNPKGAQFSLHPDGTFAATNVAKALPLPGGCAESLASGTWQFVSTGAGNGGAAVEQSSWLALDPAGERKAAAACGLEAGVRKDSQGVSLCLVVDPDQTCGSDELLRRAKS